MIKALFAIGKTQWSKWNDAQREAFNDARAAGVAYADAIQAANEYKIKKQKDVLDLIEDVAETVVRLAPAAEIAKTVVKAATKKKAK